MFSLKRAILDINLNRFEGNLISPRIPSSISERSQRKLTVEAHRVQNNWEHKNSRYPVKESRQIPQEGAAGIHTKPSRESINNLKRPTRS